MCEKGGREKRLIASNKTKNETPTPDDGGEGGRVGGGARRARGRVGPFSYRILDRRAQPPAPPARFRALVRHGVACRALYENQPVRRNSLHRGADAFGRRPPIVLTPRPPRRVSVRLVVEVGADDVPAIAKRERHGAPRGNDLCFAALESLGLIVPQVGDAGGGERHVVQVE